MKHLALLGFLLFPVLAEADEVFVRGGGHLTGEVVERRADSIVVDVGVGRIGLPTSYVERIVPGASPLAVYQQRAGQLGPKDAAGWLALGEWARSQDLSTKAREAFERVLTIDPDNAAAHRALGHVQWEGEWMTAEASYRARGYVLFQGTWMSPEEREDIRAERAAAAEESRARAEADAEARVREAEARADAAEEEAQRAQADLSMGSAYGGGFAYASPYPYSYGFGATPFCASPAFHSRFRRGFPDRSHRFSSGPPRFVHRFPRAQSPVLRPSPIRAVRTSPAPRPPASVRPRGVSAARSRGR
jgi:hypothetical protein